MIKDEDIQKRSMYTLKKPHTHDGMEYTQADIDEGVEIELDEDQALVLQEQGIIEAEAPKNTDDTEKPEAV